MKNLFIFICLLIGFVSVQAQTAARPLVISKSGTTNIVQVNADSINKGDIKYIYLYSPTLFTDSKVQIRIDTVPGYSGNKPKIKVYQYSSLDNTNWVYLDSATVVNGVGLYGVTAKVVPYAPYMRYSFKGIDSTQSAKLMINILTVKAP